MKKYAGMISAINISTGFRESAMISLSTNNREHAISHLTTYCYIHFNEHDGYTDHQVSSILTEY